MEELQDAYFRAKLILNPKLTRLLEEVFREIFIIRMEYGKYQQTKESTPNKPGVISDEERKRMIEDASEHWNNARERGPQALGNLHARIELEFRTFTNGRIRGFFWNRRIQKYRAEQKKDSFPSSQ